MISGLFLGDEKMRKIMILVLYLAFMIFNKGDTLNCCEVKFNKGCGTLFENGRLLSQTQDSNMGPLFYGTVIGKKSWATVSRQEKGRLEIEIKKLSDLFADLEK